MRVVSGSLKGLKLKTPKNMEIRPTSDRVKEALFNIIQNHINLFDINFLDLFAGTGNIGIEALSRGAAKCVFVDSNYKSVKIIRENIKKAGLEEKSIVLRKNVLVALDILRRRKEAFEIIFMDPPYGKNLAIPVLEMLSNTGLLKRNGYIIVEHSRKEALLEKVGPIRKCKHRTYGSTIISFYIKEEEK